MHAKLNYTLYLGSTSASRQMLLREAGIPFVTVTQSADETKCDWNLPLKEVVEHIALYKMQHVQLPVGTQGQRCFVLTADTLTENAQGKIEGKPIDRADAVAKLKGARAGAVRTGTAFVLERRIYQNNQWEVEEHMVGYAQATYIFDVADAWMDFYLDNVAVSGAGAIAVEGFGNQFLQKIDGSYAAVIGLPMFELRQALERFGFFE
jgi:septum formation protein